HIGSLAGGGRVSIPSGRLWAGGNNLSTTFAGTISGGGGLSKEGGTSVLTLSGSNNYTGDTGVEAGVLLLGRSEVLANDNHVIVSGTGNFNLAGFNETIGSMEGNGHVTLASGNGFSLLTVGG